MSRDFEAKAVFDTLCQTLDNMKWRYEKDMENGKYRVTTTAVGDDLTMKFIIRIDIERQVMYLKSPMPFPISENKRAEVGMATLIANYAMLNGCFEYDLVTGYLGFKLIIPFMDSIISEAACDYMIKLSCSMVDKFNDKFLAVSKSDMTLDEFQKYTEKAFQ